MTIIEGSVDKETIQKYIESQHEHVDVNHFKIEDDFQSLQQSTGFSR